ncbi:uncharacterized protein Z520_11171 [Fonsecaea multimorphosa CBS 102226]|uniref:GRF-type domain-containing protein n=1 Tax=Fonsecaea multimorphosa CBS 102226 TaxID=1442371 RepID=A0A0D2JRP0_9EURO|nr:uncharacterized protein Z520_11171 [Fonsecaea multimorphosa CBS 102226]KIX93114.1 hypothetical protein Z520_11171 [Fonsecaea multimorphosa CBS 102226]OAL18412.1 hypothetical protein AYO22_10732 [Fonsecaea multimorphosa]
MANSYTTRNGRTAKRGAFLNGVWHCDCEPRMPADKFQVKNGGKNHGRWFYTCQKPQHKRCKFFLWNDDAKVREEAAVLSNSRTEPNLPAPLTPQKKDPNALPLTPQTRQDVRNRRDTKEPANIKHDESFDWSSSNDEELLKAEQDILEKSPFQTPKKAPRTESLTSPGKRKFVQAAAQSATADETWPLSDDVFTTPSTTHPSKSSGLLSPSSTPANRATQHVLPETEPSTLASEALDILRGSRIDPEVEKELVDLLNRHDLRTQGIIKGRDITRLAVQAKEKKIAELQARIAALEAEKETNKRVISHLKHDMAASPKRGKGRSAPRGEQPEA